MDLFWRQRTTSSSILRNTYLLLSNLSSSIFAPEGVAQPSTILFTTASSLQRLSDDFGSGLNLEIRLSLMTNSSSQRFRGGRMCRPSQTCTEGQGKPTVSAWTCGIHVGGEALGGEPWPDAEGHHSCSKARGPCCSAAEDLMQSSAGMQLLCGDTAAIGQATAAKSGQRTACPSWVMTQDDPTSVESCLCPKRSCLGHNMKRKLIKEQNESRCATNQMHSSHRSGDHMPALKSAKRRAAEALLAARFGRVTAGSLPSSCPPQMWAGSGMGVRPSCLHSCSFKVAADLCVDLVASATYGDFDGVLPGSRNFCSSGTSRCDVHDVSDGSDIATTSSAGTSTAAAGNEGPSSAATSLAALQKEVDLRKAAAAEKARASAVTLKVDRSRQTPTGAGSTFVPRSVAEAPCPPSKRARLSLSAAVTSSLGAGLSCAATATAAQPSGTLALTTVPPCDPARGCKAKLQAGSCNSLRRTPSEDDIGSTAASVGGRPSLESAIEAASGAGSNTGAVSSVLDPVWCSFAVSLPPINWQPVFDEPPGTLHRFSLARGYEKLILPQGLVTYVVENPKHIGDAIRNLKAGMQDRLVAIDLEWRPETVSGRVSPVALIQLSSASVCIVVRTCCMGYDLPAELRAFLEDPSHVLLGFAWDSADEAKMRGTFGIGRANFRRFLDLQEVAMSLGYHGFGLSRLSQQVLGLALPKSKTISRSNWAAPQLTSQQLKYASLDVLVAGQLFRALRLWHSSPSPCADCRNAIGELLLPGPLRCGHPSCGRSSTNLQQHRDHCLATGHPLRYTVCGSCGRLHELPVVAAGARRDIQ